MAEVEDGLCRLDRAGEQSEFFRIFSVLWTWGTFTLMFSGVIAWLYYRQHLIYIRKRSVLKVFLVVLGLTSATIAGSFDRAVPGRESEVHSCPVQSLSFILTIPFYVLAGLSQVVLFRNKYAFYKALGKNAPVGSEASSRQSYFNGFDASLRRKQLFANEVFVDACVLAATLVFIAIVVGVNSTMCPEFGKTDVCEFAEIVNIKVTGVLFPMVLLAGLISVYIHRQLKTFPDPFNLLGEIKTAFFYGITLAVPGFILAFLNFGDPNGQEEVPFSYSVWIDAVLVFVFIYSVHWQIYKGMKFDEIRSLFDEITLAAVLNDSVGRDLLRVHLTNEFSLENLLFIEAVEKFRRCNPDNIAEHAQIVFGLFFKEDILNIQYQTEKDLKDSFEQGRIALDMFDNAYNEVYQLISRDSFGRFKLSADFETYIGLKQADTSLKL